MVLEGYGNVCGKSPDGAIVTLSEGPLPDLRDSPSASARPPFVTDEARGRPAPGRLRRHAVPHLVACGRARQLWPSTAAGRAMRYLGCRVARSRARYRIRPFGSRITSPRTAHPGTAVSRRTLRPAIRGVGLVGASSGSTTRWAASALLFYLAAGAHEGYALGAANIGDGITAAARCAAASTIWSRATPALRYRHARARRSLARRSSKIALVAVTITAVVYTRYPAVFFPAWVTIFVLVRRRRSGVLLALEATACCGIALVALQFASNGWYWMGRSRWCSGRPSIGPASGSGSDSLEVRALRRRAAPRRRRSGGDPAPLEPERAVARDARRIDPCESPPFREGRRFLERPHPGGLHDRPRDRVRRERRDRRSVTASAPAARLAVGGPRRGRRVSLPP